MRPRDAVRAVCVQRAGTSRRIGERLEGSGLRLMARVRRRVLDRDVAQQQLTVRDGKGQQDRGTMLPMLGGR